MPGSHHTAPSMKTTRSQVRLFGALTLRQGGPQIGPISVRSRVCNTSGRENWTCKEKREESRLNEWRRRRNKVSALEPLNLQYKYGRLGVCARLRRPLDGRVSIPAALHRCGSWCGSWRVRGARGGCRPPLEFLSSPIPRGHTCSLPRPFQGSPFNHPLVHLIQHQQVPVYLRKT